MRAFLLLFCFCFAGCDKKTMTQIKQARDFGKQRDKLIANGRQAIPYAAQFHQLYPQGWQDLTKRYGAFDYYSEVGLHKRYMLQMTVPFQTGPDGVSIASFGRPEFYLCEYVSVERGEGGTLDMKTTSKPEGHLRFGSNEWSKVVAAKRDFSVLGYQMVTNKPLDHFDETWNSKHERIKLF